MYKDKPLLVCWGGGVNSTALLVGLDRRDIIPDLILFADTKAEKPETYQFLQEFNGWLSSISFPEITVVSSDKAKDKSLEASCLRLGNLPSIAYGFKTCSMRWKKEPQDRYANSRSEFIEYWNSGDKVYKAIGFDLGEHHRAKYREDERYLLWYPLIEWGWGREECVAAITESGLSLPIKSSCFFCPSSRKYEIVALRSNHPDLYNRAIAIERKALSGEGEGTFKTNSVKGLGRSFSWESLAGPETLEVECMCYDGSAD